MKKICTCKIESAFYTGPLGELRCQYCDGLLTDKKRIKEIEDYNTPKKNEKTKFNES